MDKYINLSELPPPPSGKTGWPWTQDRPVIPTAPGSPLLTIVMPSYNQAYFIEEAIRSVLLQAYPNLEFIILDGGSSDGSVEVIKKYAPWLAYWHSRKDNGQTSAINHGFRLAKGDIVAWLNTDDTYLPGAFAKVIPLFSKSEVRLVYGNAFFTDENNQVTGRYPTAPLPKGLRRMHYWSGWPIAQPTTFFRKDVITEFGFLDENFHYAIDYDWFIRLSQYIDFHFIDEDLAYYRIHSRSKTSDWDKSRHLFHRECLRANLKYAPVNHLSNLPLWIAWSLYQIKQAVKPIIKPLIKPILMRPDRR